MTAIDDTDAADVKIVLTLANDVNTTQKATIGVVGEHATKKPTVNYVDAKGNELKAGTIVNVGK